MSCIVEVDEHGTIRLPLDKLPNVKPHSRFHVEPYGDGLILSPVIQPSETQKSVEAWIAALENWAKQPCPPAPSLSDEALRRENIY